MTAARLHQAGVVNRVVANGTALDEALKWSEQFAGLSPNACAGIKSLLHDAPGNTLSTHFNAEKNNFVEALHHRDGLEGITAFLEKRKADYR